MEWVYRGRAFKYGDNLCIDGQVMPLRFVIARETNPEVLKEHVLEGVDPDFPKKVKPGDILVAGANFAQGNPHAQGFKGIKALGIGIVAEWTPRGAYRNCVVTGVPTLPKAPGITKMVEDGDELEVNFQTGEIKNHTRGTSMKADPMPPFLQEIIAAGGSTGYMKQKLVEQGKIKGS